MTKYIPSIASSYRFNACKAAPFREYPYLYCEKLINVHSNKFFENSMKTLGQSGLISITLSPSVKASDAHPKLK